MGRSGGTPVLFARKEVFVVPPGSASSSMKLSGGTPARDGLSFWLLM